MKPKTLAKFTRFSCDFLHCSRTVSQLGVFVFACINAVCKLILDVFCPSGERQN